MLVLAVLVFGAPLTFGVGLVRVAGVLVALVLAFAGDGGFGVGTV